MKKMESDLLGSVLFVCCASVFFCKSEEQETKGREREDRRAIGECKRVVANKTTVLLCNDTITVQLYRDGGLELGAQ